MEHDHSTPTYSTEAPDALVASLAGGIDGNGTVAALDTSNGHANHSMGSLLNVHEVYEAAVAVGIDADQFIADFSGDMNNFNDPRHVDWWYPAATLAVLNDLTAAVTMGGLDGDHNTLELIQGAATQAAFAGNGADIREILTAAGGDVSMLTDDQLVNVWGTNSHFYNHNALKVHADDGSNLGFKLTHLRSLNDNALDGTEPGTRGGYNDRGEYPERPGTDDDGFYDYGRAFLDEMAYVLPADYEADGSLSARNGGEVVRVPVDAPTDQDPAAETPDGDGDAPVVEPATTGGLDVALDVRNDWGNGATIDLVVTNTGTTAIDSWEVAFDLAPDISESWNAEIRELGGDRIAVGDVGWNGTLEPGETTRVTGFNVAEGNLDEAALNEAADFVVLEGGQEQVDPLSAVLDVRNDWDEGATIDLILTNNGTTAIEDWEVEFALDPTIYESWNGEVTNAGSGRISVGDVGWNGRLDAGETMVVSGFNVAEGNLDEAALNANADFLFL